MKHRFFYIVFAVFMSFQTHSSIALAECPDFEIVITEVDSPAKKTWKNLYRSYKSYPGCDDGALAEAYSDFVAQSLSKYWDRFDELVKLTKKDPSFQEFVIKHIDATADQADLKNLLNNVRTRCPSANRSLCKEIERAALSALE